MDEQYGTADLNELDRIIARGEANRVAQIEANTIRPGDVVTLEDTRGTGDNARTVRAHGTAYTDDEGALRVDGVNVTTDADGYYPAGVVVVSITKPQHLNCTVCGTLVRDVHATGNELRGWLLRWRTAHYGRVGCGGKVAMSTEYVAATS